MERDIINYIESKKHTYIKINNDAALKIIHDLLINNIEIDAYFDDSVINLYYGYYYEHTKINNEKMEKYYLMAIDQNYASAMYKLGYYYQYTKYNNEKMEKYYLMAINQNNSNAMYQLGHHYQETNRNDEKMEKY